MEEKAWNCPGTHSDAEKVLKESSSSTITGAPCTFGNAAAAAGVGGDGTVSSRDTVLCAQERVLAWAAELQNLHSDGYSRKPKPPPMPRPRAAGRAHLLRRQSGSSFRTGEPRFVASKAQLQKGKGAEEASLELRQSFSEGQGGVVDHPSYPGDTDVHTSLLHQL